MSLKQSVPDTGTRRLVRPAVLAASAVGFVGVLATLYPLTQAMLEQAPGDDGQAVSLAYMRVLLRSRPDDSLMRLALVRKLSAAGEVGEARTLLAPLLAAPGPVGLEARLALLEIERAALAAQPRWHGPERAAGAARVAAAVLALLPEAKAAPALLAMARAGREAGRPDLAAQAMERLAASVPGRSQYLVLAARDWLAAGQPAQAGLAYRRLAKDVSQPLRERRVHAGLALDAFKAAGQLAPALAFAQWAFGAFGHDRELVAQLVTLARELGQPTAAQRYGRALLAFTPRAPAAIERQLAIELEAGALPQAQALAARLVTLAPSDARRVQLARIAEWNAAQHTALAQWMTLGRKDPAGAAMARALALAAARGEDGLWLVLVARTAGQRQLAPDEQSSLVALAERRPALDGDSGWLARYLARYSGPAALWQVLAEAQARAGRFDAALDTLREMPALPAQAAVLEAQMLARAGRPEQALRRLRGFPAAEARGNQAYAILLGDLAWQAGSRDEAVRAYRAAWSEPAAPARVAERLIEAANAGDRHAEAIAVARLAWQRTQERRWLLLAMDGAARGKQWGELRALLGNAGSAWDDSGQWAMYWRFVAMLASHDGRLGDARAAHGHWLALEPDSVAARLALLWFEIDHGAGLELDGPLARWAGDAGANPAYWGAYAQALLQRGSPAEALPWLKRQLALDPGSATLALQYAETLAKTGQNAAARQQRRAAYMLQRRDLEQVRAQGAGLQGPAMLAHARLVREFEGERAAQAMLTNMIAAGTETPGARRLLVESLLAGRDFSAARVWIARALAAGDTVPGWQQLAVARAGNDSRAIARLLADPGSDLSTLDRISAMRALARDSQALALAETAVAEARGRAEQPLLDVMQELRIAQSTQVGLAAQSRRIGALRIDTRAVQASTPFAGGRAGLRLAHNRLGSSGDPRLPGAADETELEMNARLTFGGGTLGLAVGSNRRGGETLGFGRVDWERPLDGRTRLRLAGAARVPSEESAVLRAAGTKDKLGGALDIAIADKFHARLDLAAQRYAARTGERLAHGYRIAGELGTTFASGGSELAARLSASWERNRLAAGEAVPGMPAAATIEDAVAPRFAWAGAGATLRFGGRDVVPERLHGSVDVVVGKQWPQRKVGYGLRAALHVPLASGELRAEAFQSNVQGAVGKEAVRGFGFAYEHRF